MQDYIAVLYQQWVHKTCCSCSAIKWCLEIGAAAHKRARGTMYNGVWINVLFKYGHVPEACNGFESRYPSWSNTSGTQQE